MHVMLSHPYEREHTMTSMRRPLLSRDSSEVLAYPSTRSRFHSHSVMAAQTDRCMLGSGPPGCCNLNIGLLGPGHGAQSSPDGTVGQTKRQGSWSREVLAQRLLPCGLSFVILPKSTRALLAAEPCAEARKPRPSPIGAEEAPPACAPLL
jgi:hypothetical protein